MSTSEKQEQEPEPDAKCEQTDRLLNHIPCFIIAICCTAFGFTSLTHINPEDNYLESMIKLLPVFGAANVIQAVILHASLLRAIWKGRYPDEMMSPCQRFAWNFFCCVLGLKHWRHIVGFCISALCAFSADRSLWKALRCAREMGERTKPSRAACVAEMGHASTTESTADVNHPPTPFDETIAYSHYMLFCSFIGFFDLGIVIYYSKIDAALAFFGPIFLTALIIAALMPRAVLSLPRKLHGSNGGYLVSAYRCGGLYVLPWTCLALAFAMWYYKDQPLYPGVYAAGYWASAVYVGVGEVLEQSLLAC